MSSSRTPNSNPSPQTVLEQVSRYLESEIDAGRASMELSSQVLAQLRAPPVSRRAPPAPAAPAAPNTPAAAAPNGDARTGLDRVARTVAECQKCALHQKRTKTVPGQGCATPEVLFVGEGPGAEEDALGLAFVGAAGQLLTKMIEAMGYRREDVFIANIVKCRPPDNRRPEPDEMAACLPYLREQIALLQPKVIVALGATALKGLLDMDGIMRQRGKWLSFGDIPVMPTFHPSYLLRAPSAKRDVWEDLKAVLQRLGREAPKTPKKA